jgi:hypothetical protein
MRFLAGWLVLKSGEVLKNRCELGKWTIRALFCPGQKK